MLVTERSYVQPCTEHAYREWTFIVTLISLRYLCSTGYLLSGKQASTSSSVLTPDENDVPIASFTLPSSRFRTATFLTVSDDKE
jgi:hypothetical protein